MKKATKGALATVAGGTLLLGGAGTLAYWTDTSTVTGGTIAGGTLSLGTPTCAWTIAHQGGTPAPFDPLNGSLVPGDIATQSCTSTIVATGQNLVADLTVTGGTDADGNALEDVITPTASFLVEGSSVTAVTSANDGDVLTSTLVLDFPFGTEDNDTNDGLSVVVTDYVITATQRDLTP